jgi:hypothetical protein
MCLLTTKDLAGVVVKSHSYGLKKMGSAVFSSPTSVLTVPLPLVAELKVPELLYDGFVDVGTRKGALPSKKILLLGILSGIHIGFGIIK